jgi:surface antigen
MLAGCSMSLFEGDTPQTTGSIAPPVEVQQPLPPTLAYSDATKIGQAATAVVAQAEGSLPAEWVNASTGSSGTVQTEEPDASAGNCRQFSTMVTSVGGVHQYSGAICQNGDGNAIVQIDERSKDDRS